MHAEQETFLTALASDFNMEVPYLEYMVQACPEASNEILFRLIPSLKRDGCSTFLAMSLFPRVEDLLETQWRMESFLLFNPQNPTGRYKLKLESSTFAGSFAFLTASGVSVLGHGSQLLKKIVFDPVESAQAWTSLLRSSCSYWIVGSPHLD